MTLYDNGNGFFSSLVFRARSRLLPKSRLGELYQTVKNDLVNSKRTGFLLKHMKVKISAAENSFVIEFANRIKDNPCNRAQE